MYRFSPSCGLALVLSAVLGMAACASAGPTTTAADDRAPEAALLSKINATIGDAPCTADTQCRTLGVGARACGGPAAWRAWSTQTGDGSAGNTKGTQGTKGEQLQSLADQLASLQRERQARSGMASTCQYLADPGAVCQAQRCVLKKPPDAGS